MRVDFSTVKEFEPLPSGYFEFEVVGWEEKEAADGQDHGSFQVSVLVLKETIGKEELLGKKYTIWMSLDPERMYVLRGYLYSTGQAPDPAYKGALDFDESPEAQVGLTFGCQVELKSYTPKGETEPKKINNYKKWFRLDGSDGNQE